MESVFRSAGLQLYDKLRRYQVVKQHIFKAVGSIAMHAARRVLTYNAYITIPPHHTSALPNPFE